jgi:hypothetical protein
MATSSKMVYVGVSGVCGEHGCLQLVGMAMHGMNVSCMA